MVSFFLIALLVLFAAVIFFIAGKLIAVTYAKIPKIPHKIISGNYPADCSNAIPRVIWSYWHELPLPEFISLCQDNWRRYAPDHEIRLINRNTITEWIAADKIPDFFFELPPYRQADWLRLQLLAEYGGIWADASIIMTQNLDWLHATQQREASEYVGFYINLYTSLRDKPIIENWFMAAIKQSQFIRDLAAEFNHAIHIGEESYLEEIATRGKTADIVQAINPPRMQRYLIMHVAASALLDRSQDHYRLALYRAEDTAYSFHSVLNWSKRTLCFKLALTPCPKTLPFMIKLRGGERNRLASYIANGWYYSGSLAGKFLQL